MKELLTFPKRRGHPAPRRATGEAPGFVRRQKRARGKHGQEPLLGFLQAGKVGQGK